MRKFAIYELTFKLFTREQAKKNANLTSQFAKSFADFHENIIYESTIFLFLRFEQVVTR